MKYPHVDINSKSVCDGIDGRLLYWEVCYTDSHTALGVGDVCLAVTLAACPFQWVVIYGIPLVDFFTFTSCSWYWNMAPYGVMHVELGQHWFK